MPAPTPLTACDPPDLDWSRPNAPASSSYADIYFSVEGGLAETEAVFLKGCGLPEAWMGQDQFVIGELGFGTGLNFLAAWRLWEQSEASRHLHFLSVENYPLDADDLRRALSLWPELKHYADRLISLWPGRVKGGHRLHLSEHVTLTVIHDDVRAGLKGIDAHVDAWFLDGFSPSKNPDMWSQDVMAEVARLSRPGARLASFTVAGAVREALTNVGFDVEKKPGYGRKRHRLEAVFTKAAATPRPEIKPLIIGAGIAGASLAQAFKRRGIAPTVIDANDGTAASGNPAAIIKPRLDLQDRPISRFYLSSYLYTLSECHAAGAVLHEGIHHVARSDDEIKRYEKFHTQGALPEPHVMPREDGVYFGKALVVDSERLREAWLSDCHRITARAEKLESAQDAVYAAYDSQDALIASGTHVFICAGFGVRALGFGEALDLRYSRGQLTWAEPLEEVDRPVTYGGYSIPLDDGLLVGTTHARVTTDDPFEINPADDQYNLGRLSEHVGQEVRQASLASRASVRVNTKTTQPIVKELSPNCHIMTGLGSRGFVFAPLLAEDLVSKICEDPSGLSPYT